MADKGKPRHADGRKVTGKTKLEAAAYRPRHSREQNARDAIARGEW